MIYALLDTNVYLRLAKRIRPILGVSFGAEQYQVTILKDVENEVRRNNTLTFYYPWFSNAEFVTERLAKQLRLSDEEKSKLENAKSVIHGTVKGDKRFIVDGRSPPSPVDCRVLAFSQIRKAVIVTDDEGMHILAEDFDIEVWHGCRLLQELRAADVIDNNLIIEIYEALENNQDMTKSWADAKKTTFVDIFSPPDE